jgi:hypothetical protein
MSHDKYSENSKNLGKTFRNILEHDEPNEVFGAHEKIFWSIQKLDYAQRKVGKSFRKSRTNSREVCRNKLMDEELK